jgi:integrase
MRCAWSPGAALTRAMREELVPRNVARLVTLPHAPAAKQASRSAAEARRFLDAVKNDPLYPPFVLLLLYGLRRGEVLGLSWRAVDFDKGVIRVEQQLFRAANRLQLGPVKTGTGRRGLPLLGIARDALIHQEDMRLLGGPATDWTPHDLVFVTKSGYPVEPRNLARSFERSTGHAKLRPIRLHDLRHTTATL